MDESSIAASWCDKSLHRVWLDQQGQRLLDFSKNAQVEQGFVALDENGRAPKGATAQTILTARMTHAYALGYLRGLPGCLSLVEHGIASLTEALYDKEHGGWLQSAADRKSRKLAYVHAFVALAASSAFVAGIPGATILLERVLAVIEQHFWSEEEGVMRESFAFDWSDEENYRGANSNMHSVEMALAVADALNEPVWRKRAIRIASRFVHQLARSRGFRLVEHFDCQWQPLLDYNHDCQADDLRPYGLTPGHFLEWAHLLLNLEAALHAQGEQVPSWLLESAIGLFDSGTRLGWGVDGAPGIVYTVDWHDLPNVRNRPHWVMAEAIKAAHSLFVRTGDANYARWYISFWDYTDRYLIDHQLGSWHNEVNDMNQPSALIYPGKADLYHAYQATLTPMMPLSVSLATALVRN